MAGGLQVGCPGEDPEDCLVMVVRSECVGHRGIDERGHRLNIRRSRHYTIRDVCKWTMPISDWKAALTRISRLRQLKSEPFTQNLGHSPRLALRAPEPRTALVHGYMYVLRVLAS